MMKSTSCEFRSGAIARLRAPGAWVTLPLLLLIAAGAWAAPARFVIDDDEYVDKVLAGSARLLEGHKLVSADVLRSQVHTNGCALLSPPILRQKLEAPEVCDHLRESTLAIGSYYQCPDCDEWHFNSSGGFIVGTGVVSTCCHVVVAKDDDVKESYIIAADAQGNVFPVRSVLAADPEADTCFLKVDGLPSKPLPLRTGVRAGERVYCLSHPGGYYFMFTQGMVARVNRRSNEMFDEHGRTNGLLSRPILLLNVTAEFAPGSSGAPIVDEAGNVVGQVASITDAGEPPEIAGTNAPPSPSVPVRFCTAAEEILRLTDPRLKEKPEVRTPKPERKARPDHKTTQPQAHRAK